jgi:protein-L-isoaspartate(D-aspartate) O-methyltransferase
MDRVQDYRRFYAEFIVRSSGCSDERLISAFAAVPREHFVGRGPWQVFVGSGYIPTISDDPRHLYHDILVGLATDRKINNGQPSLHARCLAAAAPMPGETVVHIGAGTGYYTAILARLVGPTGRVAAFEIEADLAARARDNLSSFSNVSVTTESAATGGIPAADVIYVNAGATHPPPVWLDALKIGGRLIFPLTPDEGFGVMLQITRKAPNTYTANALSGPPSSRASAHVMRPLPPQLPLRSNDNRSRPFDRFIVTHRPTKPHGVSGEGGGYRR